VKVLPAGEVVDAVAEIGSAVEKGHAADATLARADHEVLPAGMVEGGGIAKAGDLKAWRRRGDDGLGVLGPGIEVGVGGDGEELRFAEVVGAVREGGLGVGNGLDAGVEDGGRAVVKDGGAGEDALGVGAAGGGGNGDRQALPVDHVRRDSVRPVHVSPDGGMRIVLMKHVVPAAPEDGGAGVVHPIAVGEVVEAGTEGVGEWGVLRGRLGEGEAVGEGGRGGGAGEGGEDGAAGVDHGGSGLRVVCGAAGLEASWAVGVSHGGGELGQVEGDGLGEGGAEGEVDGDVPVRGEEVAEVVEEDLVEGEVGPAGGDGRLGVEADGEGGDAVGFDGECRRSRWRW